MDVVVYPYLMFHFWSNCPRDQALYFSSPYTSWLCSLSYEFLWYMLTHFSDLQIHNYYMVKSIYTCGLWSLLAQAQLLQSYIYDIWMVNGYTHALLAHTLFPAVHICITVNDLSGITLTCGLIHTCLCLVHTIYSPSIILLYVTGFVEPEP